MGINYDARPSNESRRQARTAKSRNREAEPEKPVEEMTNSELQARASVRANRASERSGRGWQSEES